MSERRIPGGLKDEHGVYTSMKPQGEPDKGQVVIDDLMSQCLLVLWREIYNLNLSSKGGLKLSKEEALELRENVKLLMDLKKKETELLNGLTDEQLEELERIKGSSTKGNSQT